jgi:glutathione S-transferase
MLKLYYYAHCPFCERVRISLAEKKIPYERIAVDLDREEEESPAFRRLNPLGRVPVLVDGKNIICESTVINEYLEERFRKSRLMPSDPKERAEVRYWVHYSDDYLMDTLVKMFHQKKLPADVLREMRDHLKYLNGALRNRQFLAGRLSLADVAFYPFIRRLDRWGISLKPYKNVDRWIKRLEKRPAFRQG